ncbi:Metal-dependent hydrolase, endonuclease/exonuclease/phosphatase family [Pseudobutyrivibrio sp. YE44]|uniref:endonuclease/exonuclease/phosphatase family protein n=1 Tax=Pseudobutyrivibrio sp. YE44 TaxID=1520802 RepID=UPI0008816D38|nr:endonuclease/exonuclease/phosphatase family protein [Pseudobutyrivibrio sp. YE44]SDB08348.1 Metal-dependent hydrolase, endonuclease/exonuclease/phosphatase family [Pseudobutyrivibrio sp. YE44]
MTKKFLKAILYVIIALVVITIAYFSYVLIAYHRIDDNLDLIIEGTSKDFTLKTNQKYRITSANLGFGAYSDDYSFFMDGGKESWARSKDAVYTNINGSIEGINSLNPDIMLFQEVDLDSTRSYHVNQKDLIIKDIQDKGNDNISYNFAVNYDSPFLMAPIYQPHGKSKAGLLTVSPVNIKSATRRSLPIEEGFSKLIDLDRCYVKNVISVSDGNNLVLYNTHLSAYTTDPSTATNQLIMLFDDMNEELQKGNYVIAGGDLNKDILLDSSKYFHKTSDENWAAAFPTEYIPEGFQLIQPLDEDNPVPSCRNANEPYNEATTFVLTVDGFIVSSNVKVEYSNVLNTEFKYSDHNPIYMDFMLKE